MCLLNLLLLFFCFLGVRLVFRSFNTGFGKAAMFVIKISWCGGCAIAS